MRIGVLSSQFPPARGGVSAYTHRWAAEMRELGNYVVVLTSENGAEDPNSVTVGTKSSIRVVLQLLKAARLHNLDLIVLQYVPHAYSRRGGGFGIAAIVALLSLFGVRTIVNAHEYCGPMMESVRRFPWHVLQRFSLIILVLACDKFVVTTGPRASALRRLAGPFAERVVCIPIAPTVLCASVSNYNPRDLFDVDDENLLLVTSGMGHPSLDAELVIAAFNAVKKAGHRPRLLVAGELRISDEAAENLGYVDECVLSGLMAGADIFILPYADGVSARRSLAISAFGLGAAVVSTFSSETDFEITSQLSIGLSPAGDQAAFESLVLSVAASVETRLALREVSRSLIEKHYGWAVVTAEWNQLVKMTLHDRDA